MTSLSPRVPFEYWFAVEEAGVIDFAETGYAAPLFLRLAFLAMGEANRIGHAPMGEGELRERLQVRSAGTGEVKLPTAAAISSAIKRAKSVGLLGEGSSARCLQTPNWHYRGAHLEAFCHFCKVDHRGQTKKRRGARRTNLNDQFKQAG